MDKSQFKWKRPPSVPATPVSATSAALSAGANTVTVYTAPTNRQSVLKSLRACYTGTVAGVTLQAWANGVAIGPAVGGLTTGVFVDLFDASAELLIAAAQVFAVRVTGATNPDTISYTAQVEDR